MKASTLSRLLLQIRGKRVLVVGDIMVDKYIIGETERISPEAPVPVVHVTHERYVPGGAANAANNLRALGITVELCGCIGDDFHGDLLMRELTNNGIGTTHCIVDFSRPTITKVRVLSRNQQMFRYDIEKIDKIAKELLDATLKKIMSQQWDAILVSDYNKGMNAKHFFGALLQWAKEKNIPTIVDPKIHDATLYAGAFLVKPNKKEAYAMSKCDPSTPIEEVSARLAQALQAHVLVTLADKGMHLHTREGQVLEQKGKVVQVHDVTGAGDTVAACMAAAICAKATLTEAMELATLGASICVRKVGTAFATPEELLREATHDA